MENVIFCVVLKKKLLTLLSGPKDFSQRFTL